MTNTVRQLAESPVLSPRSGPLWAGICILFVSSELRAETLADPSPAPVVAPTDDVAEPFVVAASRRKRKRRRRPRVQRPASEAEAPKGTVGEPEPDPQTPPSSPQPDSATLEQDATPSGSAQPPPDPAGPPPATPGAPPSPAPAPPDDVLYEEVVDFAAEEEASDRESASIRSGSDDEGGRTLGFKLFVDLLLDHRLGEKSVQFHANHVLVFLQLNVRDDLQLMVHIHPDPIFFEVTWSLTPRFAIKAGKLLVPFGINEFHHIIGGRVDELSSFLPETWGDFGVGVEHLLVDSDNVALEYEAYLVNGFSGVDEPIIGAGTPADNNWAKGLGTRWGLTLFGKTKLTGSAYADFWDEDSKLPLLFYAVGLELLPGLVDVPVLDRLRLRGEWARGEIRLPSSNFQQGLLKHAIARSGYFAEATYMIFHGLALRFRAGRVNPDNRETDAGDIEVYEPALIYGVGSKLMFTLAYQMVSKPGLDYAPEDPADLIYGKLFVQF